MKACDPNSKTAPCAETPKQGGESRKVMSEERAVSAAKTSEGSLTNGGHEAAHQAAHAAHKQDHSKGHKTGL